MQLSQILQIWMQNWFARKIFCHICNHSCRQQMFGLKCALTANNPSWYQTILFVEENFFSETIFENNYNIFKLELNVFSLMYYCTNNYQFIYQHQSQCYKTFLWLHIRQNCRKRKTKFKNKNISIKIFQP